MEHLLPAGHSSMHSRVLGPGGWGAEGGSGEGAHDLQDAVKPGAAKSALFPVTSFLDGLALSPPPQRLHRLAVWTGPAGEAFLDVVCCTHHDVKQRSPSGFMVGIYQINHTTDQRRTKSRPLGKSTPLPHPIRDPGTRAKFRLAVPPPLMASSVIHVFRSTLFFSSL